MFSTFEKLAIINASKGLTFITFANLEELIEWAITNNGPEHFYEMYEKVPKMLEKAKKKWDESQSQ